MSNNPFIEQTPAHARYPDISSGSSLPATPQSGQLPQQTGFGFQPSPYNQGLYGGQNYQQPQQQQQQYQSLPQPQSFSQPQYTGSPYGGTPGYQTPMMTGAPRSGFQPTSSFGQQLSAQVNGNYGYSQQAQPQQYGGYGQQSSMQPPNWSAVAQFDPYAQLGNALDSAPGSGAGLFGGNGPASPTGMHQRGPSFSGPVTGQAPQAGQLHPRELVRAHKFELEKWDPYAWKQLMNSFDALRGAWEARKRDAQNRMAALGQTINYDYGAAQEYGRLQGVSKDAENNHDTVAASAFQVLEVQGSYRQSGDTASKRRVRESLNASLNALPDWPPQQW